MMKALHEWLVQGHAAIGFCPWVEQCLAGDAMDQAKQW